MLDDPRLSDYVFALKHYILSPSLIFFPVSHSFTKFGWQNHFISFAQIITQTVFMTQKVTLGHILIITHVVMKASFPLFFST